MNANKNNKIPNQNNRLKPFRNWYGEIMFYRLILQINTWRKEEWLKKNDTLPLRKMLVEQPIIPLYLLVLLMCSSPAVRSQFTDVDEPVDPTIPNTPSSTEAPERTTTAAAVPAAPIPAPSPGIVSSSECADDSVTFELVTGFVYSAPTDILDSQPGTLMLTDCIQTCRQNQTCRAVNYETGLCVLFSSNADSAPGKHS